MIVKVKFKNNKFYIGKTEVNPPEKIKILLQGKGSGSSTFINKDSLQKTNQNGKNN